MVELILIPNGLTGIMTGKEPKKRKLIVYTQSESGHTKSGEDV